MVFVSVIKNFKNQNLNKFIIIEKMGVSIMLDKSPVYKLQTYSIIIVARVIIRTKYSMNSYICVC